MFATGEPNVSLVKVGSRIYRKNKIVLLEKQGGDKGLINTSEGEFAYQKGITILFEARNVLLLK